MARTEFIVEGMSCQHCVKSATRALESLPGVNQTTVDLESSLASVEYDETQQNESTLFDAIRDVDFTPVKKNVNHPQ